jgi:hypothetical protein
MLTPAVMGDKRKYDKHTLLMCHFDGDNESTTIIDSVKRHTLTAHNGGQSALLPYVNGHMDELRISDIARWTSNFTPPTEPYR